MERRFSGLGMFSLIGILLTVLFIAWYAVGTEHKQGAIEQGTQAVDESKAVKAALDAHAEEENRAMNQVP